MPVASTVLVVCTANVCRSPFIQLSLQHRLRGLSGTEVVVESAGTRALTGSAIDPRIERELGGQGIDATGFVARQLVREQIDGAGLVIAASREHRTAVAQLRPRALSKVFTLRQLVRLIQASEGMSLPGADPAAELAAHCARMRGMGAPSAGTDDDVPDPWRGTEQTYAAAVELMASAVDVVVGPLSHAGGEAPPGRDY